MITAITELDITTAVWPPAPLFDVSGIVAVRLVVGEIIEAVVSASTVQIAVGPIGVNTANLSAAPVGTLLSNGSGQYVFARPSEPLLLSDGTSITWDAGSTPPTITAGKVRWTVQYEQVTEGAVITAV